MIQTKDRFLAAAGMLLEPVVIVDTSKGSRQAKWHLIDGEVLQPLDDYPEIPRALFNGLRDQGVLYEKPDDPLKVGGYRAFMVNLGEQNHGRKEEQV